MDLQSIKGEASIQHMVFEDVDGVFTIVVDHELGTVVTHDLRMTLEIFKAEAESAVLDCDDIDGSFEIQNENTNDQPKVEDEQHAPNQTLVLSYSNGERHREAQDGPNSGGNRLGSDRDVARDNPRNVGERRASLRERKKSKYLCPPYIGLELVDLKEYVMTEENESCDRDINMQIVTM